MLIRISLIVAVVAALAVGVINFVQVKEVITTTRTARDDFERNWQNETAAHTKTKQKLSGTEAELASTKDTLRSTEEARNTAVAEANRYRKSSEDLTNKLKETTKQRDDALADLAAWSALGIPVEGVKAMMAELKDSKEAVDAQKAEIQILTTKNRRLENELAYYRDPEYRVKLPEGLKGQVLVFDPKWDFVVLNVGEDQGVLERGELLLSRDGKLVAKVRVFRVDKDRCIANVVNGWKIGAVAEGDTAFPAF